MLLTFANILIRTGYRRFKIPAISSAILFELQRTLCSLNSERYFCRSRQKKMHFLRCCVRKHTTFCKENRKFAEVLDFEPIF